MIMMAKAPRMALGLVRDDGDGARSRAARDPQLAHDTSAMDSYLTLLATARSLPSAVPTAPTESPYKLSARHPHAQRKRRHVASHNTTEGMSPRARAIPTAALSPTSPTKHAHDAFRSVSVLGEVVRLEADASREKMQPEDAFTLLRRVLTPQDLEHSSTGGLSLSELLHGLEAACWRAIGSASTGHDTSRSNTVGAAALGDLAHLPSPTRLLREAESPRCRTHSRHEPTIPSAAQIASPQHPLATTAAADDQVKLRYAQLYSGAQGAIAARRATCASLTATLEQTTQRIDALPAAVAARETELRALKQTYMASAARALDCADASSVSARRTKSAGTVVDTKVQTLRRRRDLRAWACNELRDAINEHVTRASELKKAISAIVTEVKREELAHKAKAKRIEAIMAAISSTRSTASAATDSALALPQVRQPTPEERVTQAQAKKLKLLETIAQRKTALRARTEAVFTARSEVERLEQAHADVVETTRALTQEVAHVQRSCTPRPDWTQLLDAAVVTTAVDRVGKHTKLRIQRSRHKLVGGKGRGGGAVSESDDGEDESDEHRLKQMLTSNWSTIEKVAAMATELTRIRTKYHADDAIGAEQAKLDHLQREIAKTLQQLDAIKGKAHE